MQRIAVAARRDIVQLTILLRTNPTDYTVVHSEIVHVSMRIEIFDQPGQWQVELLWLLCRQHSICLLRQCCKGAYLCACPDSLCSQVNMLCNVAADG